MHVGKPTFWPEWSDGVDVVAAGPGYTASSEVPNGYPAIIAAHCQLCTSPVEGAGQSFTATVQHSFIMLQKHNASQVLTNLAKL